MLVDPRHLFCISGTSTYDDAQDQFVSWEIWIALGMLSTNKTLSMYLIHKILTRPDLRISFSFYQLQSKLQLSV